MLQKDVGARVCLALVGSLQGPMVDFFKTRREVTELRGRERGVSDDQKSMFSLGPGKAGSLLTASATSVNSRSSRRYSWNAYSQ